MLGFIKRKKFLLLGAIAIIAIVATGIGIKGNGTIETVSPVTGDLVRTVKISGKIAPKESAALGFEISGVVSEVSKRVGDAVRRGDVLARVDASTILSDISKAEAELALAQAELGKLEGSTSFETLITNAKQKVVQTIKDAYAESEDAVYNKTDQFFVNVRSIPQIGPTFIGYSDLREDVEEGRVQMDKVFEDWKDLIAGLNASTYTEEKLSLSKNYLLEVSSYIANVFRVTSLFEENDFYPQDDLDSFQADTATARNNINTSTQNLLSAENELKSLLLDVPGQVARVESARASLLNSRSKLSKTSLISPIDGILSIQDAKIGQVVSANTSVASVITNDLEIEAYIPEVLIAGVTLENPAKVTLDAYGAEIFEAQVVHIDPAETIRDGVSTYKVRLAFNQRDERIRPGMTANVEIETFRKPQVTLIPERTVVRENGESFVYVLFDNKDKTKTKVTLGERDSNGNVELLNGVTLESKLIINPVN